MATINKIGFCKCHLLENGTNEDIIESALNDIQNNHGVQFKFDYSWNGTTCTINNVEWKSVIIRVDEEHGTRIIEDITLASNAYKQSNKLTITFGNTSLSSNFTFPSGNYANSISQTSTSKYISASFIYSYTNNNVEYYISIPNIKIPKASKYEHNVIFTENGLNELLTNIKNYPIIDIDSVSATEKENLNDSQTIWQKYTEGKPCIKINYGNSAKTIGSGSTALTGHKYVAVGSNIKFKNTNGNDLAATTSSDWNPGTFRVSVNNEIFEVPIKGLTGSGSTFDITAKYAEYDAEEKNNSGTKVLISDKYVKKIGSTMTGQLYINTTNDIAAYGEENKTNEQKSPSLAALVIGNINGQHLEFDGNEILSKNSSSSPSDSTLYLSEGNGKVELRGSEGLLVKNGPIIISNSEGVTENNANKLLINPYATLVSFQETDAANTTHNHLDIKVGSTILKVVSGGQYHDNANSTPTGFNTETKRVYLNGGFKALRVYNAVFNDYAECRTTIELSPGHVVIDNDDGSLSCSSIRLQPGAQVISDTYGTCMGETDTTKTPLAVAGRVLVYTYQPRENYHAGMAVCSAPNGTVDIMTREEIRDYPDCIIGIVSEIPQYETWGTNNVAVNGRIWIKVK